MPRSPNHQTTEFINEARARSRSSPATKAQLVHKPDDTRRRPTLRLLAERLRAASPNLALELGQDERSDRRSADLNRADDDQLRSRLRRRMKVKGVWTCGVLLGELGVGVGDDELKRRVWDCGPAAVLAALTA